MNGDRPLRRRHAQGALAGLVAGGLTLGVGELTGVLAGPGTAPFLLVGNTIVDLTPEWLKSFAISTFGENDKAVLLGCLGVVLALFAALAGWLQARRPPWGLFVVAALGAVAVVAGLSRPDSDLWFVVPAVAGVLAGGGTLWLLVRSLGQPAPVMVDPARTASEEDGSSGGNGSSEPAAAPAHRRRFLTLTATAAGLAVLSAVGGRWLEQTRQEVREARERLRMPPADDPMPELSPDVALDVDGITEFVTPNSDFYRVDTALQVPAVRPDEWQLRIHGLVERNVELSFGELLDLPLVERMITLTCVSNEVGGDLVGNAVWLGYPLRDLIAQAGPHRDADMVLSTSVDGFSASTPLAALTDERDALLAVGMNGEPLPPRHGFPVRMVVPGLYGYVSATKWVVDLEITRFDRAEAYWTERDWAPRAPIKMASRIDVPASFAELPAGQNVVAGVAWAQHTGIDGVEVSVDGDTWEPARLADEASIDTWRQWFWEWDAEPGRHTVRVRAIDSTGEVQTGESAPTLPDGATGWHSVVVEVV